jgi:putative aldouronate transport system permease protein
MPGKKAAAIPYPRKSTIGTKASKFSGSCLTDCFCGRSGMNIEVGIRVIKNLKKEFPLHLMMLIPVALIFVYIYIPIFGIIIAFQDYKPYLGVLKSKFVGFDNFIRLFTVPGFVQALINTVTIALAKIVTGLVVPVVFSLLLNEVRISLVKRTVQTIIYLPFFVSWVLMAGIIMEFFSPTGGVVNNVLGIFGIEPIFFLGSNKWFQPTLIITNIWKEFGWGTVIYMAALAGVDLSLYEAAVIDGAGRWKQTIHVTLPSISTTIVLLSVLSLGNILNAGFDQVFNLMSNITMKSGDIIDTLIYRTGLKYAQFGLATAAGLFKSAISFSLMIISYRLAYKWTGYKVL